MPDSTDKIRENRLRRMAKRRGLLLVKSRRRDTGALDYGLYVLIIDGRENREPGEDPISAFDRGEGRTLDQVEEELTNVPAI